MHEKRKCDRAKYCRKQVDLFIVFGRGSFNHAPIK